VISAPLIAWMPDADPTQPGVIPEAQNLLPTQRGYAPDFGLLPSALWSTSIPAAPRGVGSVFREIAGERELLVGTQSAIYWAAPSGVFNISATAPYNPVLSVRDGWRFDTFGAYVLAVSRNNAMQQSPGPASTLPWSLAGTGRQFVAIAGAPAANCIAVQGEFVMLANFNASSTWPYTDGWWCSAAGDHADWTLDTATFCAQGRLVQTPGPILRLITFGDEILAFKARSILRGRFTGQPSIPWAWDIVSTSVGIVGHDAICDAEGVLYWLADDGFYAYNGGAPQRIAGAPLEWFKRQSLSNETFYAARAAWDTVRRVVRWAFIGQAAEDVAFERLRGGVAYHPDTGRWGPFSCDAQAFVTLPFDNVPMVSSLTARRRADVLAVISTDTFQFRTFRNESPASSFETTEVGDEDVRTVLTKARFKHLGMPYATQAVHLYRDDLGSPHTVGEIQSAVDGKYDFSQSARWHRLRFGANGMYELLGMRLRAPRSGDR
jgi:hypothetical protein